MSAFEEYLMDGMPGEWGAWRGEDWATARPAVPEVRWSEPGVRGDGAGLRRGRLERRRCASAGEPAEPGEPGGCAEAFPEWPVREGDGVLRVPGRDLPC
ncbi:hypothetical protein VM95_36460 [Streptomyces rubellomurinus]|uniref:Uncharacterized protein n=1 Tax=Streptomyces rubellomurinus (strain ATCC 31215) TaxID=359131 RepID=A0A0F2T405_STRR3|nr:hypothetical protein VM95_36460 [Streptomyces rubellomurinus]